MTKKIIRILTNLATLKERAQREQNDDDPLQTHCGVTASKWAGTA